jgi:glycosyltransferase involved in cell wall biosynthesis
MINPPRVSVIMNCYNGSKYLTQAIESVIQQTYPNWELIFWDNRSIDQSARIIKSFQDSRIKYFLSESHTKLSTARNAAINESSGELIAFLDVDDWWEPQKLQRQVPQFQDDTVGLACSNFWILDERISNIKLAYSSSIPSGHQLGSLLRKYTVALPTLVIRKSLLNGTKLPFNPAYHIIGDFDLVIRLSAQAKVARLDDPLATYRIHGHNESVINFDLRASEILDWVEKNSVLPPIGENSNFPLVSSNLYFNLGLNARRRGDIQASLSSLRKIGNFKRKFILLACLLLPLRVLNRKYL